MSHKCILYISLLIFTLLKFIITQDSPSITVYTNQNIDFSLTRNDIINIINNFKTNQSFDGMTWSYVDPGWTWNGHLTISSFNLSVTFDDKRLTFSEVSDGFYISGNDSIVITLNANFEAKTGISTSPTGKITIKYTTSDWYLIKRIYKNDTKIIVDCSVTSGFFLNWNTDYSKTDDLLNKYINLLINNNATQLQSKFLSDFNTFANSYYQSNSQPIYIPIQTANPNKTYNVDMSFWADPFFDLSRDGVIYYFNGVVSQKINSTSKGFLRKEVKNTSKWDNFEPADGDYQVFFSFNLFSSLMNKIANEHSFNVSLSRSQLSNTTPFNLDIESLGEIYPGVYNNFSRDSSVLVEGTVIDVNFSQLSLIVSGKVSLLVTIKLEQDQAILLQWISLLNVSGIYSYENQTLNLVLEHDVSLEGIEIIQNPYGSVNINQLNSWVQTTFDNLNDWPILKKGIDFNSLYSFSNKNVIPGQGILIYGHYILPESEEDFRRILTEKIKYLI